MINVCHLRLPHCSDMGMHPKCTMFLIETTPRTKELHFVRKPDFRGMLSVDIKLDPRSIVYFNSYRSVN